MPKILFSLLFLGAALFAEVKVVTSTSDLAWAAKEIGKEFVDVKPLLNGTENPHYVDAVPEYIRLAALAEVVCIVGLELEVGWMPKVLSRSGNAKVQPGGKGYCETGKNVQVIEKPSGNVDRSMGDVHPAGNPHFWLSPKTLGDAAREIRDALVRVDPNHAGEYNKNYDELLKKLQTLEKNLKEKLKKHLPVVATQYHKEFSYFFQTYGIESLESIEEKPGVLPSAGRIATIATASKAKGVKFAIAAEYAPHKTVERFTEVSGIPVLELPTSIQPEGKAKGYNELQTLLVDAVISALQKK